MLFKAKFIALGAAKIHDGFIGTLKFQTFHFFQSTERTLPLKNFDNYLIMLFKILNILEPHKLVASSIMHLRMFLVSMRR
jgi:hypothetical protein